VPRRTWTGPWRRLAGRSKGGFETTPAERAEMPHGGLKQSGYGKDMSMYALEDYTVIKHVMAKLG